MPSPSSSLSASRRTFSPILRGCSRTSECGAVVLCDTSENKILWGSLGRKRLVCNLRAWKNVTEMGYKSSATDLTLPMLLMNSRRDSVVLWLSISVSRFSGSSNNLNVLLTAFVSAVTICLVVRVS